jgi:hypothetical protein
MSINELMRRCNLLLRSQTLCPGLSLNQWMISSQIAFLVQLAELDSFSTSSLRRGTPPRFPVACRCKDRGGAKQESGRLQSCRCRLESAVGKQKERSDCRHETVLGPHLVITGRAVFFAAVFLVRTTALQAAAFFVARLASRAATAFWARSLCLQIRY